MCQACLKSLHMCNFLFLKVGGGYRLSTDEQAEAGGTSSFAQGHFFRSARDRLQTRVCLPLSVSLAHTTSSLVAFVSLN